MAVWIRPRKTKHLGQIWCCTEIETYALRLFLQFRDDGSKRCTFVSRSHQRYKGGFHSLDCMIPGIRRIRRQPVELRPGLLQIERSFIVCLNNLVIRIMKLFGDATLQSAVVIRNGPDGKCLLKQSAQVRSGRRVQVPEMENCVEHVQHEIVVAFDLVEELAYRRILIVTRIHRSVDSKSHIEDQFLSRPPTRVTVSERPLEPVHQRDGCGRAETSGQRDWSLPPVPH
ncbi:hypothetical protein DEJ17_15765 [Curtobacterium sp. MCSS17_011]|nr:hypothetical protein DEJ17_15765 [Curtobacterium sp. MCSS17_011]